MNTTLLTVIVPCYNMEKYLNKCIESITRQMYTMIDILLIDDGSSDNTPALCDEWRKKDKRIRVIHKKNEGLAYARKTGIENTKTKYVTFVDADDQIHPDMYQIMMKGMLKESADISQCGVCDIYENGIIKNRVTNIINDNYTVHDRVQSVIYILDDTIWRSYMWNKIFEVSLFKDITFPYGRGLDEDTSIMHELFHKVNKTIYFQSEFYYYLARSGSISKAIDIKSKAKNVYDRCNARNERYLFTAKHEEYKEMLIKMKNISVSVNISGLRFIAKHEDLFPKGYFVQLLKNTKNTNLLYKELMPSFFSKLKKIEFIMLKMCPYLHYLIFKTRIL